MIVLSPPTLLIIATQNALPGDFRYPVKRKLEEGVLLLASVNPVTKSYFNIARTGRRFNEAKILISNGKPSSTTLQEFVGETKNVASDIKSIKNQSQKRDLANNLSKSIIQYDKEFESLEKSLPKSSTSENSASPKPVPYFSPEPKKTAEPSPTPETTNENQQEVVRPEDIQKIREELKKVQEDLQREVVVLDPVKPATQGGSSNFPQEVQDIGDLDKYLGDLYNLNVSSVKLILPE